MTQSTLEKLKATYSEAGQSHVFQYYDKLSPEQQQSLVKQLSSIDPKRVNELYKQATSKTETKLEYSKLPDAVTETTINKDVSEYRRVGLTAIKENKVGVLLLAGGQGTRLGSALPKGCYDINLPSHKSLFQIQAEKIKKLQELTSGKIIWYIMISEPTRKPTIDFFEKHQNFGLDCLFFEQGVLPALKDGKIILEDAGVVSVAPDGNGGIYAALRSNLIGYNETVLQHMEKHGIEYIHTYCVDNVLVKVADPVFVGYCIKKGAECGAKVVYKENPDEQVGVVCEVKDKISGKKWFGVVEYSEISKEDSERRENGVLVLNAGNIANHFYTLPLLKKCATVEFERQLQYHIANKKIKFYDGNAQQTPTSPNGIKLELFIFDIFPFVKDFCVLYSERSKEFSALKNKKGDGDCEVQSRRDYYKKSADLLQKAGAQIEFEKYEGIEIKGTKEKVGVFELGALTSYDGEGLEEFKGKKLKVKGESVETIEQLKSMVLNK